MIHWYGDSRNGNEHWNYECETFYELHDKMEAAGLISDRGMHSLESFEADLGYPRDKFKDADWHEFIERQKEVVYHHHFETDNGKPIIFDTNGDMK